MRLATLFLSMALAAPVFAGSVTGKWAVTATDNEGQVHRSEMSLQQVDGALKGELRMGQRSVPLSNVAFLADELTFKMPWQETTLTVKMKLDGDEMKGQVVTAEGDSVPVSAKRMDSTPSAAASAAGKWKMVGVSASGRETKVDLDLKQDGDRWSGLLTTQNGDSVPVTDLVVDGVTLSFKVPADSGSFVIKLTQSGESFKGTFITPDGATGNVTATR